MIDTNFLLDKANILRLNCIRATTRAGSGHPTSCLSCAEIVATLFFREMRIDPKNIDYLDNDEFILSKGHAAPILYAVLAEIGTIRKEKLMTLRDFSSPLEGHPIPRIKGVRVATGSLGQGLAVGLGIAIAKKIHGLTNRIYVLLGDGEMAEGSVWEAINLAGKLGLSNITAILDMNRLGQSGPTMYQWDADAYVRRIQAFDWFVQKCDGHDPESFFTSLTKTKRTKKPSFIIAKTTKGKGVSFLEDKEGEHGKPLSETDMLKAESEISKQIKGCDKTINFVGAKIPPNKSTSNFTISTNYRKGQMVATREAYGLSLEKIGEKNKNIIALDGDVQNSTYSKFFFEKYPNQSLQCYIAEQNMVSVGVGLQTQGFNVFLSTFACFLSRSFDQIRMASHSRASLKIVGSHSGVSIGEDGPSQMGLEDIAMFRSIFNSIVLYPCDAVSGEKMVSLIAGHKGISYLRTSRPKTPVIYSNEEEFTIGGSKILRETKSDKATIVAAGITVHESLKAWNKLRNEGINIRVVDCYSIKPLDTETLIRSDKETKNIITVEDHYAQGGLGEAVASVGLHPRILAVTKVAHSGKADELLAEQGIDAMGIVRKVKEIVEQ